MTEAEQSAYEKLQAWVDSLFSGELLKKAAGKKAKEDWKPPSLELGRKYEEAERRKREKEAAEKATPGALDALSMPPKKTKKRVPLVEEY